MSFNGMNMGLGILSKLATAKSRSITAENVYGEKGRGGMAEQSATPQPEVVRIGQAWEAPNAAARDLGQTWKVRPCIKLPTGTTTTLMDVDGPGCIQHLWITLEDTFYRDVILRVYWDGETQPSVEVPLGDFFCNGFRKRTNIVSLPINVNWKSFKRVRALKQHVPPEPIFSKPSFGIDSTGQS
jgi:hypothetical protein